MAEIGRVNPADREANPKKWEKVKAVWIDHLDPTELEALPGETLIIVLDRYDIEDLVKKGHLYFEPDTVRLLYARPELAVGKRGYREAEKELQTVSEEKWEAVFEEMKHYFDDPSLLENAPDNITGAVLDAADIMTLKMTGRLDWKDTLFIYDNR